MPDDVTLDTVQLAAGGEWHATSRRLVQARGLRRSGQVDEVGASVVARCDGHATLVEVLTGVAVSYGLPPEELVSSGPAVVRGLVADGFLVPVAGLAGAPNEELIDA